MASILCEYEEMSKLVQTGISSIQTTSYVKYVGSCAVRIAFSLVGLYGSIWKAIVSPTATTCAVKRHQTATQRGSWWKFSSH